MSFASGILLTAEQLRDELRRQFGTVPDPDGWVLFGDGWARCPGPDPEHHSGICARRVILLAPSSSILIRVATSRIIVERRGFHRGQIVCPRRHDPHVLDYEVGPVRGEASVA